MRGTSRSLALILASAGVRCTFGFQSLRNKVSLVQKPEFTCHSTKLCAKFKLDNGMDDEDDRGSNKIPSSLRNIDLTEEDFENVERTNAPSTTFGAEGVPLEQRPANEYLDLISAPFFDWANRPGGDTSLVIRLGALYAVTFAAVCWPISGATFTMDGYLSHKILSSTVGALGFILVFCVRLYSGWGYIGDRLTSKGIEFEETGWFDGDVEMKSEAEVARDLLLFRQDVKPVVERMKKFSLIVGGAFIASCVGLNVVFQAKPLFNEYDAGMLERLVYDDKMANVAAEQSGGIPTYCNSRYYQAVANGGQGCK